MGIVHMTREPTFEEICDQMHSFENQQIRITYCPFCGKLIDKNQPLRDAHGNPA